MKRKAAITALAAALALTAVLAWWLRARRQSAAIETPWGPARTAVLPGPPPVWYAHWEGQETGVETVAAADQLFLGLSRSRPRDEVARVFEDWAAERRWKLGDLEVREEVEGEYIVELTGQRQLALGGNESQAISAPEVLAALDTAPPDFGAAIDYVAPKLLPTLKAGRPDRCSEHVDQWANKQIGAKDWWSYEPKRPVRVAVLDMGVSNSEEDLKGRVIDGVSVVGGDPYSKATHGTGMAGIIGALHNGDLVDGVTRNASIVSIRISITEGDVTAKKLAAGLSKVINMDAVDVAVAAVGFASNKPDVCREFDDEMETLKERGVVVVVSVPNSTPIAKYPAACQFDNLLVVGAVDEKGNYLSAVPSMVQMVAPGQDICTVSPDGRPPVTWWGSSSSAAVTAGAIALVLSAYPQDQPMTAFTLLPRLRKQAKKVGDFPALCLEDLHPDASATVRCHWPPS